MKIRRSPRWLWAALIVVLLALRLPSLVQPAGGDQGLYGYAGQRILAGDVMYRDMWDQKPPAIAAVYALLWRAHPDESIVPAADLAAAALVAWLLVVIGRRRYSEPAGFGAAAVFLLFGDPYLQRLSGVYVRGQCEPFISLAVTGAIAWLAHPQRSRRHLVAAGISFAAAFWLKYNAAAFALPLVVAIWSWNPRGARGKDLLRELLWMAAGFLAVSIAVLAYFAVNGALKDLWLATIDYNLRYSNETYESRASIFLYVFTMPLSRARIDMIWFLGALGSLLLVGRVRAHRSTLVALAWVAAAVVSVAINGHRGLPNYFVQAFPALALAASAGLARVRDYRPALRVAVAALLVAALWRVGSDKPVMGLRLASIPGLVQNVRFDLSYVRGRIDRETYLQRFRGQKFDAPEIEHLVAYVRQTTAPSDPIYVFGFSGGSVCWKSKRQSASRFFWSRPVFIEFAADRPGYGSAGLLDDLKRRPPAIVALQNEEWRSRDFFMKNGPLRSWLEAGYTLDRETPMFSVWRKRS